MWLPLLLDGNATIADALIHCEAKRPESDKADDKRGYHEDFLSPRCFSFLFLLQTGLLIFRQIFFEA